MAAFTLATTSSNDLELVRLNRSISIFLSISNLFTHNRALIKLHKHHQSCFAQAFLHCAFQLAKTPSCPKAKVLQSPKRLEPPKVTGFVDVEIRLSARWRALPRQHCSVRHYAERRHDSDPDNCRLSCSVS